MYHSFHKKECLNEQQIIILEWFLKDTRDWSNDAENSAAINYILKYIEIENGFKLQ